MYSKRSLICKIATVIISVFCNITITTLTKKIPNIPLFMDTIFTVAATFYGGLIPGLLTGLCTNLLSFDPSRGITHALYALCNMSSALVVFLFIRKRPLSLPIFDLLLLAIQICFANSLLGGIISTFFFAGLDKFPSDYIVAGMIMQNIPIITAAILSRIPINMIDKTIAVTGGYGISLLATKWVKFTLNKKIERLPQ